jgi:hypothetical protein
MSADRRQVIIETDQPPGCPSCGVIASWRKERRLQRLRDIPVAGPVDMLWSKYRGNQKHQTNQLWGFFVEA